MTGESKSEPKKMSGECMDVAILNLEKKLQRLNSSNVEESEKSDIPKAKDFKQTLERFSSSSSIEIGSPTKPKLKK